MTTKRTRVDDPHKADMAALEAETSPLPSPVQQEIAARVEEFAFADAPTPAEEAENDDYAGLLDDFDTPEEAEAALAILASAEEGEGESNDPNGAHIAQVLAAMQQEIARLKGEVSNLQSKADDGSDDAGDGGYPWQYYRRTKTHKEMPGWLTVQPGGAIPSGKRRGQRDAGALSDHMRAGFQPIEKYGPAPHPSSAWQYTGGVWHNLLTNGGAVEFPVDQVLSLKWHINPPIAGITFPQVEAVRDQVQEFGCDECQVTLYFLPKDKLTPKAALVHMTRIHGYSRQEAAMALQAQGIHGIAPFALQAGPAQGHIQQVMEKVS